MYLTSDVKAKIAEHCNLREWFAFKDWVSRSNLFNPDEKASIITYGMHLMMQRYNLVLP